MYMYIKGIHPNSEAPSPSPSPSPSSSATSAAPAPAPAAAQSTIPACTGTESPLPLSPFACTLLPVSLSSFLQVRLLYLAKDHSYEARQYESLSVALKAQRKHIG